MFGKLLDLLRGPALRVQGSGKLPEGSSKRIEVGDALAGGKEVILCRVEGRLYALDRRCPHEAGKLQDGPMAEGRYVVCPVHRYKFDPKTGAAVGVACKSARTYTVREHGADCEIRV
jgi:nitrite reductase/ring-hydroxylating ferredoxin subunit